MPHDCHGGGRRRGQSTNEAAWEPANSGCPREKLQAAVNAALEEPYRNDARPKEDAADPEQEEKQTGRRGRPRSGKKVQENTGVAESLIAATPVTATAKSTVQGGAGGSTGLRGAAAEGRKKQREEGDSGAAARQPRHVCSLCMRGAPSDEDNLRLLLDHLFEDHGL